MKLSTKGIYGITAMLDLAIHQSEGVIPLKSIAERQNISESYLEQIFSALRKAGIISSVRGAQGGYKIKGDPDDITVGNVLRALEGSLAPVKCIAEEDPKKCSRHDDCVSIYVWEEIRDTINEFVDGMTIKELADRYEETEDSGNYMYYI